MNRWMLFVDAGWLFAGGSTAAFGEVKPRSQISWDPSELIPALIDEAAKLTTPGSSLLRVMWFDGSRDRTPSGMQLVVARQPDVKLSLGRMSRHGQQKGVDGLIIAAIMNASANGAISDAVVLSGDEDLLPAIDFAQSKGARVSLLEIPVGGIAPAMLQAPDRIGEIDGEFFSNHFVLAEPDEDVDSDTEAGDGPVEHVSDDGDGVVLDLTGVAETAPTNSGSSGDVIELVEPEAKPVVKNQPAPPKTKPKWMTIPLIGGGVTASEQTAGIGELGMIAEHGAAFAERWLEQATGDDRGELLASRPYLTGNLDSDLLRSAPVERWLSDLERRCMRDAFWARIEEG